MNAKNYSIIMGTATIIAWVGFFTIIFNFDPQEANWTIFTLFYLALFLAVTGTLSIAGFFARILLLRNKRSILRYLVAESFRQAIIVAAALLVTLILQSVRILTWWNMALLILAAAALEFLILLFKKNQPDNFQS
jgi:hypothetical protein